MVMRCKGGGEAAVGSWRRVAGSGCIHLEYGSVRGPAVGPEVGHGLATPFTRGRQGNNKANISRVVCVFGIARVCVCASQRGEL